MATTRSSIPRLLRAAASHRTATTLLRPHHNLHHHHHTIPTPFRNPRTRIPHSISHPLNRQLLFSSISRRVHSSATALLTPKSLYSIWPYTLTLGCVAATGMAIAYKFQDGIPVRGDEVVRRSMNQEVKPRFQCELPPDVFPTGHSVALEGFISPVDGIASQYCFSAAPVLAAAKPEQVTAAMERNNKIIVEKIIVDCCEKGLLGYTLTGKAIIKDAADPSKSNSKGSVNEIALQPDSKIKFDPSLDGFNFVLAWLPSLPHLLQEGHSVVVKGFVEQITDETEEDKLDEIKEVKSDDFIKDKSAKSVTFKTRDREYRFSAEVFAKHDEKYIPTNAVLGLVKSSGGVP